MTHTEALMMALEALEYMDVTAEHCVDNKIPETAINAIKEALAQPEYRAVKTYHEGKPVYVAQEQEPLEYWNAVEGWVKIDEVRDHFDSVGCGTIYKTAGEGRVPLYTAQRKPLTDEEIRDLWSWSATAEAERTATTQQHAFARAIETAHGIKE